MIAGHGNVGRLRTGGGQKPAGPNQVIAWDNRASWTSQLRALNGKLSDLQCMACLTGGGEYGATLLFAMAQVLGCTVRAPNL